MGCVYSNQRFGSKRKSQNGESSSNSTAAVTANGVELQTSADPSRWNHSVQQNGGGGHFVADSANCASSVPFGSVFGGLSTTTPTTLGTTIGSTMATSPADRSHIFNACLMNDDLNELHHGKLEITDQSLIFRTKGQQMATVWPLKYLRKYGSNNDIFSFECGRRCSTGEGVYAFKCSNAEQLFQLLSDVIATLNSFATTLNAVNGQLASSNVSNGSLPTHHLHHHPVQQQSHGLSSLSHSHQQQQQPHSHLLSSNLAECCHGPNGANNLHHSHLPEYQNLAPFTSTADSSDGSRPHSSLESGPHTYLNSATSGAALNPNNVINSGIKSQPNYYTSNPHNHSNGSLNGYLSDKKLVFLTGSDPQSQSQLFQQCSSTLPASIKSAKNSQNSHEYVNSNVFTNNSNNFSAKTMVPQTRRKSNDQHLYENHELPILHSIKPKKLEEIRSKMTASDDLGTFCYVNIGSEPRKDRMAYIQAYNLNKSARTTPEPQCYIQLDLNNKSTADDPSEPRLVLNETAAATAEQSQQPQQQQPTQLANNSPEKNSMENLDSITSNTSARSKQGKSLRDELKQSSRSRNQSSDSGIRKNSSSGPSNNSEANKQPSATTVPYAQIDFAKTLALSNSAANHRKL